MSLSEYTKKRDFRKTSEPRARRAKSGGHRFVIQKHAATRLHYDFRLQINDSLKSWAVPKGLPIKHGDRRLAVHVEDHPLDYIDFEGTIPKGQYGGGTVMVWDRGTFEAQTPTAELTRKGKLHFVLHGGKLSGEWYLVRLREGDQWLIIRGGDDHPPISEKLDDTSVLTGRSLKQIAAAEEPVAKRKPQKSTKSKPASVPDFVKPMAAKLADEPPAGDWLYEIKFDGWRALALKGGKGGAETLLLSRNENDLTDKFPDIAGAIGTLPGRSAVIDGEIVALDADGRSSFQLLQSSDVGGSGSAVYFYAFDLLELDGRDFRQQPLEKRKARLEKLLDAAPEPLRFSPSLGGDAGRILPQIRRHRLEGLIGKRAGSAYESGRRSGTWIKLKLQNEQEFVIGGYTDPTGGRRHIGALIVGYYAGKKLLCAGKVGTGFSDMILRDLHAEFSKIGAATCPFANLPEQSAGRWLQGITPAVMKRCHWIKPTVVCQVKFNEWTRDDRLRQPVYLGLRRDKSARDVVREIPTGP